MAALRREESPPLDPNLLLGIDTGDLETLRQLLQKSSQEIKDVLTTPITVMHEEIVLRALIKIDAFEAVCMLLDLNPPSVNYRRQLHGTGPLHEAFHKANKRMIVKLIERGAFVYGAETRCTGAAPYQVFEELINEGVLTADDIADLTNEAGLPMRIRGYLREHAQDAKVACILGDFGLPQIVPEGGVAANQPLPRDWVYDDASRALETFKADRSTAVGVRVLSMRVLSMAASSAGAPLSLAKVKHLRYTFLGDFRAIIVPSCAAHEDFEDFDVYCSRFGPQGAAPKSTNPAATSKTLLALRLECKAWSIEPLSELKISLYCQYDEAKKRDYSVQYLTVFQKVNGKRKASSLVEG
ncbi:hypothetical protein M885DRAFT_570194 [Pelagophyceae sp. CCMP2097]|nr:hypothetical protein M885DRAFT_570194 [Pelagophyceae sp. CCMP2097]